MIAKDSSCLPWSLPWVVVVGGFLGAGKTTLVLAAAKELDRRGLRSAVVLNDQSEGLVDSQFAALHGLQSGEVTGGCFCCKFSELIHVMDRLRDHTPHVIFAEPVGSCTDISATTLHPLREYSEIYRVAPFTVLVDPRRAEALLREDADQNLAFLFLKQIEEADVVCFTKSDIHAETPELGVAMVRQLSARSGQGLAAWLDEILAGDLNAGNQILTIDYERYARAEAALAWLNLQVSIRPRVPTSPASLLGPLLDDLDNAFRSANIEIVHLKAILSAETGFLKAAMCANGQQPEVEGMLDASPARRHDLLLNLRSLGHAEQVQVMVENALDNIDADLIGLRIRSFHPAPPKPERRVTEL